MNEGVLRSNFGILASDPYFSNMSIPQIPKQQGNKIVTLNNQGFMRLETDPFSQQWINDASLSVLPFLEIGAAYGLSSRAALSKGSTVIANDISLEHLLILRNETDKKFYNQLYLNHSNFPSETNFIENSLGGVLFCRVGHFFKGAKLEQGFEKICDWLIPGGKLYFVAVSVYHYTLINNFLPKFIERKSQNVKYPGYIDNMQQYLPQPTDDVPKFMHAFDIDTAINLLNTKRFKVIETKLFDYTPQNSSGRGFVGITAVKKN